VFLAVRQLVFNVFGLIFQLETFVCAATRHLALLGARFADHPLHVLVDAATHDAFSRFRFKTAQIVLLVSARIHLSFGLRKQKGVACGLAVNLRYYQVAIFRFGLGQILHVHRVGDGGGIC